MSPDSSTPLLARLVVLVSVVGLDGRDELGELSLVLSLDVSERELRKPSSSAPLDAREREGGTHDGGSLATDDCAETGLALNDHVANAHLAAESGEEDDELDGVDVVGDDNEGRLLGLDEGDDVLRSKREGQLEQEERGRGTHVESRLDEEGLLALIGLLALSDLLGALLEANLLLALGLSLVLVQETEHLHGGVLVQNLGELSDRGGNLETLVKDNLLSLETNVFGPFHESGEISGRLDRLS